MGRPPNPPRALRDVVESSNPATSIGDPVLDAEEQLSKLRQHARHLRLSVSRGRLSRHSARRHRLVRDIDELVRLQRAAIIIIIVVIVVAVSNSSSGRSSSN
eukprot:1236961-Pleurochrysis_carterae.AAC.1